MKNINIFKQSNLFGRWWGNLQTIAQHENIYIQFLILSFSATSAYIAFSTIMHQWGYQMPFWMFILAIIISVCLLGLFVWRLSIPSTFATWNFQWWNNDNPLRPIVEQLQTDNKEIKKELMENKKALDEIKELLKENNHANTRVY